MNLFEINRRSISAINPEQTVLIKRYVGVTTADDGTQEPSYEESECQAQVQPASPEALQHMNNYNQSSIYRVFYLNGDWSALSRQDQTAGDIIEWNGKTWLVQSVDEAWDPTCGWTKVTAVQQQDEATYSTGTED